MQMYSQENNYFYEIKEFDENYSENAIISRFLHAVDLGILVYRRFKR